MRVRQVEHAPKDHREQEGFARAVCEGQTLTDAYRVNYSAENMAEKTVWEKASRLRSRGKVAARLQELRAMAAERTLVTIETLTRELDENRTEARKFKQASAMVAATMGKAKLHGLLVDKAIVEDMPTVFTVTIPGVTNRPNRHDEDTDLNDIADERAGGPFVKTGLDDL